MHASIGARIGFSWHHDRPRFAARLVPDQRVHEFRIDAERAGRHECHEVHHIRSVNDPPSAERQVDAIVLATVKGKAPAPASRPPLTAAARDGRVDRERDGGMSQVFCEQRNDRDFARDAVGPGSRHCRTTPMDQLRASRFVRRVQSRWNAERSLPD
jgi:hypothetical protein